MGARLLGCRGVELSYEGMRTYLGERVTLGFPRVTEAREVRKPGSQVAGRKWRGELSAMRADGDGYR